MKNSKDIIVRKLLNSVVLLMTMTMLLSILGMMIDGIIIGRFLGTDRTAAYGLVSPVLIIASLFGGLLSSGAITQLSQYKAKGENQKFNSTFTMVVIEGLIVSAIFICIMWGVRYPITTFLGAAGDKAFLQEYMLQYIKGLLPAVPLLLMLEVFTQSVQLDGNRQLPMVGIFVMLITDVVLDLMNVYIFKMDLFGMAIATTVSYYASAGVLIVHFVSKKCTIKISLKELPWNTAFSLIVKGLPSATSRLMSALRTLCLNKILVIVASSVAVAAFSVNNSAGNIMTAVGNGVASSCVMIAGIFFADKDNESVKRLLANALKYAVVFSAILGVIFFIFSTQITGLFLSGNEEAINEAARLIKFYSVFVPFFAVSSVFYSYLQGIQNVKYSNIICAIGNGGSVIICALILGNLFGAVGVWVAFPVSGVLSLVAIYIVAWIYQGHMPKNFSDLAFIPNSLKIDEDSMIEASITDKKQITEFSEQVRVFCKEKSSNETKAVRTALCIEEILYNTFNYGCEGISNPCVDTRVICDGDEFTIRFRDNCHAFSPKDFFDNNSSEDSFEHIGIKLVFSNAIDIRYTNVLQLNNLMVKY